ncbi:MAG: efflux RND transporter permease subunit [Candidatus Pacebacteria bacterium]|nr:efflux RND transporter permease subunit [Candidatus Paceibacterota bacterium]
MNYEEKVSEKLEKAFKKEQKSWLGFFIKNYRFTYLIVVALIIFGFIAMLTLPKESEPEVKVPYASVATVYIGASPTDIETTVTNKIEDKIKNLENLNTFTSTSALGFSSIFVEFEAEADLQESFRKLREAVDSAKTSLPSQAEDPVVTEIRLSDYPIVTYSLIGNYSDEQLKTYADTLEAKLESVKDVSKVEIIGGLEREFQVIIDQSKLSLFNLSLSQVVSSINANNFSLPAGTIEIDNFRYNVRIKGKIGEAFDLENLVIATYNESPVFLKDIATIKDTYKEKNTESRIGYAGADPQNTISLQVYKKVGGNILNIVENSQTAIDELKNNNNLPSDIVVEKTNDNSVFIKEDLNILGTSAIQTFILIALILLAILSLRGAIITALAVPIAFLMSFMFLKFQGMTLNSMVLFSLVLSLGLMVDNAIVIIEGINEYVEKHKKSVYKAAILSVWNFKAAITAGTLTTVSAFLPMLLVSGIMGEYMSIIPKTLTVTLLSSLFVALIIIPTLVTRFIKIKKHNNGKHRNKKRHIFIKKIVDKLAVKYRKTLISILPHKKRRRSVIIGSWMLFLVAIAIPAAGFMRIEMFPKIDFDYFYVNIELPVGSNLEKTEEVTEKVENIVKEVESLDNYVTNIGSQMSAFNSFGGSSSSQNKASITINLNPAKERKLSSIEIAEKLRDELSLIQGAKITVDELQAGPPSGSPIEVRIFSNDNKKISELSKEIGGYLNSQPNIINVNSSLTNATGEFVFTIDRQKANYYGLSASAIASTVRNALFGTTASAINIDNEDIDIVVKYAKEEFVNINDLKELLLLTPSGQTVALKQVADVKIEPSLLSIDHKDGKQIATVTADVEKGGNLQLITQNFLDYKNQLSLDQNTSVEIGGETEDVQKSFQEMFYSMIVAVFLIGTILILQFNSFKQPFIILFSLPLAIIGVVFGLLLLNMAFSITVFIGIVSLAGIVVNDAIVLIDRINKNIKNGLEFNEAVIEGGVARMQPILITSITTIAGIIPLIYASEMWRGLSISIIFGLLFSTLLNLIFVPILYTSMCKKKCLKGQKSLN